MQLDVVQHAMLNIILMQPMFALLVLH